MESITIRNLGIGKNVGTKLYEERAEKIEVLLSSRLREIEAAELTLRKLKEKYEDLLDTPIFDIEIDDFVY